MRLPADLYYNLPPGEISKTASVADLQQILDRVHKTVELKTKSGQKRKKDCYAKKA